jgi:hypothetical protein
MIEVERAPVEGRSDDDLVHALIELEGLSEAEARRRLGRSDVECDDVVSVAELASLSDGQLVTLIVERSNLDEGAAREALMIIRDEIPEDMTT